MLAGSHSECLAQIVRKGLFLGGFVIWGLFGYPLYLIVREYSAEELLDGRWKNLLGLSYVPLIISGLGIQVFNLKMTILFTCYCLPFFLVVTTRTCQSRLESEN